MVLVLQRRGRTTARELADLLEVSPRTVLRDVEALAEAGLPVVSMQGYGGGIALLDGGPSLPARLAADDAEALWLMGFPRLAAALGLAAQARAARTVVDAALPATLREAAAALDDWLVLDPDPAPPDAVGVLARAARERLEVSVRAGAARRVVAPLALVRDRGRWVLLHRRGNGPLRACDVDALGDVRLRGTTFTRPDGFDPAAAWAALSAGADAVRP
jgi:predicted DNA-binding transcriptional regulator YafY